ncbi:hypothetical protein JB92DRAFT_1567718 [Gautieria morchelliformis]|nr:hypothetical protein JB92DRAFT_1567718 [Gautieria morchelliformis]
MQPSWFPQNCLVFVRNIHPDTNKTTLRTLFSASLASSKRSVDYVDFTKGIDTVGPFLIIHPPFSLACLTQCHLRLASPSDAARLVSHSTLPSTPHSMMLLTKRALRLQGKGRKLNWRLSEACERNCIGRKYLRRCGTPRWHVYTAQ